MTKGPASDYQCVDCDSAAEEWSYEHGDADETHSFESYFIYTSPYSPNLSAYRPRCKKCHRAYDKGYLADTERHMASLERRLVEGELSVTDLVSELSQYAPTTAVRLGDCLMKGKWYDRR